MSVNVRLRLNAHAHDLSVVLSVVGVCGVMEHKEIGSVKEEPCGRPAFQEYNGYCTYGAHSLPVSGGASS